MALSDEYTESMELPRVQRFSWDDTKGIYHLNAFHDLHCLISPSFLELDPCILIAAVEIATAFDQESRDGLAQSGSYSYHLHCLNAFREDIICNADDTPRYTGLDQPTGFSGFGQIRQCRNWIRLEEWAKEHTACWPEVNYTPPTVDRLGRYNYCLKALRT